MYQKIEIFWMSKFSHSCERMCKLCHFTCIHCVPVFSYSFKIYIYFSTTTFTNLNVPGNNYYHYTIIYYNNVENIRLKVSETFHVANKPLTETKKFTIL